MLLCTAATRVQQARNTDVAPKPTTLLDHHASGEDIVAGWDAGWCKCRQAGSSGQLLTFMTAVWPVASFQAPSSSSVGSCQLRLYSSSQAIASLGSTACAAAPPREPAQHTALSAKTISTVYAWTTVPSELRWWRAFVACGCCHSVQTIQSMTSVIKPFG